MKAERYFLINNISEEEKLISTAVCMEGMALNWFHWAEARVPFRSWE